MATSRLSAPPPAPCKRQLGLDLGHKPNNETLAWHPDRANRRLDVIGTRENGDMTERAHREITMRDLRLDSGRIMRAVERGESFTVVRNGVPIGRLVPPRRRVFVSREEVMAAFASAPVLNTEAP